MPWDKQRGVYGKWGDNDAHLRIQEREGVGYAAIVIAEISSGHEVLIWFQPLVCQLVSNLDIK
jgi:hypothetical protein